MNKDQEIKELREALIKTSQHVGWLIANTSATNCIIRALAEAAKDNPCFIEEVKRLHTHRAGNFLASPMTDDSIAEYEKALKELLPPSVRAALL